MTTPAFCSACGTARPPGAAFCASCGVRFGTDAEIQQSMAGGLLEIEKLRAKLIPFRIAGLALGLALWVLLLGPLFTGQFLPTIVSLLVAGAGGLWIGNLVGLSALRR